MSWQATNWVIEHSRHKGSALLVMMIIANCANESGQDCWPSKERLARDTRMSPRQLDRIVNRLERSGELKVMHSTGRFSNHYGFPLMLSNPDKMTGLSQSPTPSQLCPSNPVISGTNPVIAMSHDPSSLIINNDHLSETRNSASPQTAEDTLPNQRSLSSPKPLCAPRRPRQKQYASREVQILPADWDLTAWHYEWALQNTPCLLHRIAAIAGEYKEWARVPDGRRMVSPTDVDAGWRKWMFKAVQIEQQRQGPNWNPREQAIGYGKTTIGGFDLTGRSVNDWKNDNRNTRYPEQPLVKLKAVG